MQHHHRVNERSGSRGSAKPQLEKAMRVVLTDLRKVTVRLVGISRQFPQRAQEVGSGNVVTYLASAEIAQLEQRPRLWREFAAGWISIAAHDKHQSIIVPPQVANREQLLAELAQFGPVALTTQPTLWQRLAPLTSWVMVLLMGTVYFADNKLLIASAGTVTLGILAWSAWHVLHNKNTDYRTRRNLWWLLPLVLSIIAAMMVKLGR